MNCPILVQVSGFGDQLCNYCATRKVQRFKICRRFRTGVCLAPLLERLRTLANESGVIRASDLKKHRIHHEILRRSIDHRLLTRVDCGLYASTNSSDDLKQRIILASKRAPNGAVCLESALRFHGILSSTPGPVWMAVDRSARKPTGGRQTTSIRSVLGKNVDPGPALPVLPSVQPHVLFPH